MSGESNGRQRDVSAAFCTTQTSLTLCVAKGMVPIAVTVRVITE